MIRGTLSRATRRSRRLARRDRGAHHIPTSPRGDTRLTGAEETCNGVDDDCDGEVDGQAAWTWCQDPSREPPNAIQGCVAGRCEVIACDAGFTARDGSTADGCETDIETSRDHCGGCGNACTWACTCDGMCTLPALTSSGDGLSCAAGQSSGVWCWGLNDRGQLGDGTTTSSLAPVRVAGLTSRIYDLASGRAHTCAIVEGGELLCWGANDRAQLGDGTTEDRSTPVPAFRIGDAFVVNAGGDTTCALQNIAGAGELACWGANDEGQLGLYDYIDRTTPD